jgi:hypothetical protein
MPTAGSLPDDIAAEVERARQQLEALEDLDYERTMEVRTTACCLSCEITVPASSVLFVMLWRGSTGNMAGRVPAC